MFIFQTVCRLFDTKPETESIPWNLFLKVLKNVLRASIATRLRRDVPLAMLLARWVTLAEADSGDILAPQVTKKNNQTRRQRFEIHPWSLTAGTWKMMEIPSSVHLQTFLRGWFSRWTMLNFSGVFSSSLGIAIQPIGVTIKCSFFESLPPWQDVCQVTQGFKF